MPICTCHLSSNSMIGLQTCVIPVVLFYLLLWLDDFIVNWAISLCLWLLWEIQNLCLKYFSIFMQDGDIYSSEMTKNDQSLVLFLWCFAMCILLVSKVASNFQSKWNSTLHPTMDILWLNWVTVLPWVEWITLESRCMVEMYTFYRTGYLFELLHGGAIELKAKVLGISYWRFLHCMLRMVMHNAKVLIYTTIISTKCMTSSQSV